MPLRELSKELQEVAIKEINEDPKRIQTDLDYIKKWLSKHRYIKARTDDQFLIAFLRGTKWRLELTKEKLDMHYTLKTIMPETFHNRDPLNPEIQEALSLGVVIPLPKVRPNGPRYVLLRNGIMEKNKIDPPVLFKMNSMMQDIMLLEDDHQAVAGLHFIQDMTDCSIDYIYKSIPLLNMKKAMACFQLGYPHRMKRGHFFNTTSVSEEMCSIVKCFLTEKMKKRMFVYGSIEELCKVIPKEILPEEYGGQGGKLDDIATEWKAKVESYKEWFVEDEKYGTDQKKRPRRIL